MHQFIEQIFTWTCNITFLEYSLFMFNSSSYIFKRCNIDPIWNDYSSITIGYRNLALSYYVAICFLQDTNIIYSFISTIIEIKKKLLPIYLCFVGWIQCRKLYVPPEKCESLCVLLHIDRKCIVGKYMCM